MALSHQRIRVGVAFDSAASRRAVRAACTGARDIELVIVSSSAMAVVNRRASQHLDRIVIDAELNDGRQAITALMAAGATTELIVITNDPKAVATSLSVPSTQLVANAPDESRAGKIVVDALRATTPSLRSAPLDRALPRMAAPSEKAKRRDLVVLGCSTGGPEALATVLRQLPSDFPAPIVVVQHMPPKFTGLLASRLDRDCALNVREVTDTVVAKRGEVWIAPGDRHLVIANSLCKLELNDNPPENSCRPSVDVLFRSAAVTHGNRTVAAILTGMGDDGSRGAAKLSEAGAHIIAQDEASSVVWGMPGSVVKAGLAHSVAPIVDLAAELRAQFLVPAGRAT